jgi:ubiquinone/menaquinone biosynthesis C-methylase UbiE
MPNKAPEPTITAVTTRAPSSTARASRDRGSSLTFGKNMSHRIATAVEDLKVRQSDTVLEVGCGHGVAVDLICKRLKSGKMVAIDRLSKMIAAAKRRNRAHLEAGLVEFHAVDLEKFDPKGQKFDAILALRTGIFHRDPKKAQALVKRWLKPGGRVLAKYDEPAIRRTGRQSRR